MCNTKSQESTIDIKITDLVLTPLTCASLINEILKCLLYGKCQIPYPYVWLKNVVSRKRKTEDEAQNQGDSGGHVGKPHDFTVKKHYRDVFNAYTVIEEIMTNLNREFENSHVNIDEVMFVLGSTMHTIKEVYAIRIPGVVRGHYESNHSSAVQKNQHKILRDIFFSKDWMSAMDTSIPPTNLNVLLKKGESSPPGSFFQPSRHFHISNKVKRVTINLTYSPSEVPSCCSNLNVFYDTPCKNFARAATSEEGRGGVSEEENEWYQAKVVFKGFKDCFVDKVSVSQLW